MWDKFVQKRHFWSTTKKNEHHHQIPEIWINLGTKFEFVD